MRLFAAMDISASGLTAERLRLDVVANNLANIETTRTADGGPYRRQIPVFAERGFSGYLTLASASPPAFTAEPRPEATGLGVRVVGVVGDPSPFPRRYDPGHPDADKDGFVSLPNVNVVNEMVDLTAATRAYEANVTAINAAKTMALRALEIGRV